MLQCYYCVTLWCFLFLLLRFPRLSSLGIVTLETLPVYSSGSQSKLVLVEG